jgi:hypothetical protein
VPRPRQMGRRRAQIATPSAPFGVPPGIRQARSAVIRAQKGNHRAPARFGSSKGFAGLHAGRGRAPWPCPLRLIWLSQAVSVDDRARWMVPTPCPWRRRRKLQGSGKRPRPPPRSPTTRSRINQFSGNTWHNGGRGSLSVGIDPHERYELNPRHRQLDATAEPTLIRRREQARWQTLRPIWGCRRRTRRSTS